MDPLPRVASWRFGRQVDRLPSKSARVRVQVSEGAPWVLIQTPAHSVGIAPARLPEPGAHRLRHLGATIGAHNGHNGVGCLVGCPEVERNSNKPPCCLPQSAFFASLLY